MRRGLTRHELVGVGVVVFRGEGVWAWAEEIEPNHEQRESKAGGRQRVVLTHSNGTVSEIVQEAEDPHIIHGGSAVFGV